MGLPARAAAENFSLGEKTRHDRLMPTRFLRIRALTMAGAVALLSGCGGSRSLPREGLVARAWEGREPAPTLEALEVVAFATAQVGKPYCWGGTGPSCFDCSGLAQTAWRRVGARVPRTTHDIADALPEVPIDDVRAGDILWWPGHVGIYAGNGWVVDALDSRHGVVRRPAIDPYRAFRPAG
jgi:cell wall-associated NlpC family hydrolase